MRHVIAIVFCFAFSSLAFAQPSSVSGECRFVEPGKGGVTCFARFEFEGFQSDSPSSLKVVCEGFGVDEVRVFKGEAEFHSNTDTIIIDPKGDRTRPSIRIPIESFTCSPTPRRVDAVFILPHEPPYDEALIFGECVTKPVCQE